MKRSIRPNKKVWIPIIVALIGAVGTGIPIVITYLLTPAPPDDPVRASITNLKSGTAVSTPEQTIEGTATGPAEGKLWLVIFASHINRYFPQPGPILVQPNGSWASGVDVGDQWTGSGEQFLVEVIIANNDQVRKTFEEFVAACQQQRDCSGLPQLPDGAKSLDSIWLIRK